MSESSLSLKPIQQVNASNQSLTTQLCRLLQTSENPRQLTSHKSRVDEGANLLPKFPVCKHAGVLLKDSSWVMGKTKRHLSVDVEDIKQVGANIRNGLRIPPRAQDK